MKINFNSNKSVNFGITVSPKMKYTLIKETKKFYNRKEAKSLISLIESGSDKYNLESFKIGVPNSVIKNIYCSLFFTPKDKNGKFCLIYTPLGKLKDKKMRTEYLTDAIKKL